MFSGLSAFPLTPFKNEHIDLASFERLLDNLTSASVDSICAMGSTGLYPYLCQTDFKVVAAKAVELANGTPVMTGIGALRTYDVLKNAEIAQKAGVDAVLLAPVSYHPLKSEEVYSLYHQVSRNISVPLCVYENPGVTQFSFSDDLYQQIGQLDNIAAIKIPGMPFGSSDGSKRLTELRDIMPNHVAIGVSGDKFGGAGIAAGCDLWLSVIGGLFPHTVQKIIVAAKAESPESASTLSEKLTPIWDLFASNKGGMRVMATAADILGYCEGNCLPAPLLPLSADDKCKLEKYLHEFNLN